MENYLTILKKAELFADLNESQILAAIKCQNAMVSHHKKAEVLFSEGDEAAYVGIILSGSVEIQKIDFYGNLNIISTLFAADMIAASAVYSKSKRVPFDAVCAADTTLLKINAKRLTSPCCSACVYHIKLIENMLGFLAGRNLRLSNKIDILTKRSIKDKVLSYLFSQSKRLKGSFFTIPLSRRQMAEFLSVDRSALSRELSNLANEGLIEFEGNRFCLK